MAFEDAQYLDKTFVEKSRLIVDKLEQLLKLKYELAEMGITISDEISVNKEKERLYLSGN